MTRIIKILAGLLVLALVAIGVLLLQLNGLIKSGVESEGPKLTGTAVGLQSARVSPLSGAGALHELRIANPDGFSTPYAFDIGEASVELDIRSLTREVIEIREIRVDGASLVAELSPDGRTNLKTILDHLKQAAGSTSEDTADGDAPAKRMIIRKFSFTDGSVRAIAAPLKLDETVALPDLHLSDIGAKSGGVTAAEAGRQILDPLIDSALTEARKKQFGAKVDQVKDKAKEKLKELFD